MIQIYQPEEIAEKLVCREAKLIQKCSFASDYVLFLLGLTGFDYKMKLTVSMSSVVCWLVNINSHTFKWRV